MPSRSDLAQKENSSIYKIFLVHAVIKGFIPVALLISGLVLLALRINGWSVIVGLPVLIVGLVFSIYSYDEAVRGRVESPYKTIVPCPKCGRPRILRPRENPEEALCRTCRDKSKQEA